MRGQPRSILLVDDNSTLRQLIQEWLLTELDNVTIYQVGSAEEALEQIRQIPVDLVLLDIALPGISGIDAANQINDFPDHPTVIMLTTFEEEPYRRASIAAGAKGYVPKREMYRELIPTIRRLSVAF